MAGPLHDRLAYCGQSRDGVAVDGDPQGHPAGGLVVADLELESVEQLSLDVLGQSPEIGLDDRNPVKQARIAQAGRFRPRGQAADLSFQVLALGCDLGEAFAELAAPLLVDVLVAGGLVIAKLLDPRWPAAAPSL